jgi:hypothetical protein
VDDEQQNEQAKPGIPEGDRKAYERMFDSPIPDRGESSKPRDQMDGSRWIDFSNWPF